VVRAAHPLDGDDRERALDLLDVSRRDRGHDPGMGPGAAKVDFADLGVPVGTSDEDRMQQPAEHEVVEEGPFSPDQLGVFDPLYPRPDVLRDRHRNHTALWKMSMQTCSTGGAAPPAVHRGDGGRDRGFGWVAVGA